MSLTSRVFGLFSTTATSDPTATSESSGLTAAQAPTFDNEMNIGGTSRHAREEALEEEPRPPYLHV